jgi:hypothetical protein
MSGRLQVFSFGLAMLALLAVGSIANRGVFAQDSTATPSATAESGTAPGDTTGKDEVKKSDDGGPAMRGDGRRDHGRGGGIKIDSEALATFLGTTTDELRTELRSGQSLAQIAEAHGKTRDELKSYLIDQYSAKLDEIIDASAGTKPSTGGESTTPTVDATPAASTGLLA